MKNEKAANKRSRRPKSAPSSRPTMPNELCTASEKTKKMIEMQFKIYGVKSLADLKKNNFDRLKHHDKKLSKMHQTNTAASRLRQKTPEKLKRPHSAPSKRNKVKQKTGRRRKNLGKKVKTNFKRENNESKTRQNVDEARIVPDQNTSIEDYLYSFKDHRAFIETAKAMNLPSNAYNDKIGDKSPIHQTPAPLNLAPLSPSFVEKSGRQYLSATKSGEVFV